MTDHEEFEKWADDAGFDCTKHKLTNADYEEYDTHSAWIAWQARGELDAVRIKELEVENHALGLIIDNEDKELADKVAELTAKNKVAEESELLALRNNDGLRMQINELAAKLDKARDGDCCTEGCIKCDARKVLAETQKPVAWKDKIYGNLHHVDYGDSIPLYTTPPSREWVGLSKKEVDEIVSYPWGKTEDWVRAIDAKLREKNG